MYLRVLISIENYEISLKTTGEKLREKLYDQHTKMYQIIFIIKNNIINYPDK